LVRNLFIGLVERCVLFLPETSKEYPKDNHQQDTSNHTSNHYLSISRELSASGRFLKECALRALLVDKIVIFVTSLAEPLIVRIVIKRARNTSC